MSQVAFELICVFKQTATTELYPLAPHRALPIALAQSCIIAPSGQITAQAYTLDDEVIVATCDLSWCARYQHTLFDFERYRRPELYTAITAQKGVVVPPEESS